MCGFESPSPSPSSGFCGSKSAYPRAFLAKHTEVESIMFRDADPQHWKLLIFYYAPDNPRLFVPKMSGLGLTVNFARPTIWVLSVGLLAVLVGLAIGNN
jgi:uncharacterized membrane protein